MKTLLKSLFVYFASKGIPVSILAFFVCFVISPNTLRADITTVTNPFGGDAVESWEKFPVGYIAKPLTIFGGDATISGQNDYIWQTESALGTPGGFGLGPFDAQAQDGTHGYGTSLAFGTTSIYFNSPIVDFGGYWGSASNPITVNFYDSQETLIGSDEFNYTSPNNDGTLQWQGWQSSIPIYSISYSGAWVVNDSLRITLVPEPSNLTLMGIGLATPFFVRLRKIVPST